MINIDSLENKVLDSNNNSKQNSEVVITTVTHCLAAHSECSGRYTDYSGKHIILCTCSCHNDLGTDA